MTDFDDIPWGESPPLVPLAKPRKHRHEWLVIHGGPPDPGQCLICGKPRDAAASRRGKNNRARGLALQRKVLARMGLRSIPGNGPTDGESRGENKAFAAEVKSGGRFGKKDWDDIHKLPLRAGQVPLLVKVETPGPGKRARGTVTYDLDDWIGLYGGNE